MKNDRQFMYHHSPTGNRELIKTHGLLASSPYDPYFHNDESEAPSGVYLGPLHEMLHIWDAGAEDVWRVGIEGLDLRNDPDDMNHEFGFKYVPHGIEPERLYLLIKGLPNRVGEIMSAEINAAAERLYQDMEERVSKLIASVSEKNETR